MHDLVWEGLPGGRHFGVGLLRRWLEEKRPSSIGQGRWARKDSGLQSFLAIPRLRRVEGPWMCVLETSSSLLQPSTTTFHVPKKPQSSPCISPIPEALFPSTFNARLFWIAESKPGAAMQKMKAGLWSPATSSEVQLIPGVALQDLDSRH